jgi:DNA-binding transcriptional LysR family regulator
VRIKRLEDELGVRLFDRTSRRVRLTRDGRQLLAGARRVMSAANELTALAGSLRTERVGTLVLAFAPNLGAYAGVLLSRLAADHPEVSVVARAMWSDEALASVSQGDASAALARVPVTDPLLESELIAVYYDDHVAVSDDHPLAGAEHISVRAFDGLPVLVPEHDAARTSMTSPLRCSSAMTSRLAGSATGCRATRPSCRSSQRGCARPSCTRTWPTCASPASLSSR